MSASDRRSRNASVLRNSWSSCSIAANSVTGASSFLPSRVTLVPWFISSLTYCRSCRGERVVELAQEGRKVLSCESPVEWPSDSLVVALEVENPLGQGGQRSKVIRRENLALED